MNHVARIGAALAAAFAMVLGGAGTALASHGADDPPAHHQGEVHHHGHHHHHHHEHHQVGEHGPNHP